MYQSATGYHFCAHWYLMMVANCFPDIPAYIESKASTNFSDSSADADDCCTAIPFLDILCFQRQKLKITPNVQQVILSSD